MKKEIQNLNLQFDDPRLRMSGAGRFLVRLISFAAYAILIAAAVIFVLSDLFAFRMIGWLMALFLADRAVRWGKADRLLGRLPASARRGGKINTAQYLAPAALAIIERSFERSLFVGGDFYLHVLDRLLDRPEVRGGLIRMDVKPKELAAKTEEYLKNSLGKKNSKNDLLAAASALSIAAFLTALETKSSFAEPKDLFSALGKVNNENISRLFKLFDVDESDLENAILFGRLSRFQWLKPRTLTGLWSRPYKIRHRVMNRAWTARPTEILDAHSQDLTDLARMEKIGFLIGHDLEYDRLTDIISRSGKPNALLVGEPTSGKESIISHLAHQINKDRVPPPLFDKRLVKLEISSLVAGAKEGEVQEKVKKIIEEIIRAGNVILYIPDIHNLTRTSGQMYLNAADVLLPAIKSDAFSVIGATSPKEFKELLQPNSEFLGVFEIINVQEIGEAESIRYLVYSSVVLERQYKMTVSFGAIKQAVGIAKKYFRQKLLPSSAEDLLKEALSDAAEKKKKVLTADDIIEIAEKRVNIPIHKTTAGEAERLLNLEDRIHERLIDQEEAVRAVARSLREYRSGLSRKEGPIASFLFVGPTGVGKTELSKILAGIQFGSWEMMIRFDMSEYQEKSSVGRLLDNLADSVNERPYSLVLLDEFEKAHPDILNIFLQVFDDGRLTDSSGRTVDFQNTIIISTSNAHSDFIKSEIESGKAMAAIANELKKKLTQYFRPELLNRFSDIIVFKNLSPDDIKAIAAIHLKDLADQVKETNAIDLNFEDSAVEKIAELGYDPVFGARPLRGVISERIKSVLAEKILKNEIGRGSNVKIGFNQEFIFQS